MSVYVDDFGATFGRMKMCHMIADSKAELLAMADAIGVDRRWIQHEGTAREHFDICRAKREQAIQRGAIETDSRGIVRKLKESAAVAAARIDPAALAASKTEEEREP